MARTLGLATTAFQKRLWDVMWLQTIKNLVLILIQVIFGSRARQQSKTLLSFGLKNRSHLYPCISISSTANFFEWFLIQTLATPWRASPWSDVTSPERHSSWQRSPWAGLSASTCKRDPEHRLSSQSAAEGASAAATSAGSSPTNPCVHRCPCAALSERCSAITSFGDHQQHHGSKQANKISLLPALKSRIPFH